MKRLILIRHAKSSWSNSNLDDKERPLNERGQQAAGLIGKWLAAESLMPDQVLSSSALRCQETWAGIAEALDAVDKVDFVDFLYLATPQDMLNTLQTASGDTVLMLGHMPGIGDFARQLRRDPPPAHASFQKYPTGATTVLDFRIDDWAEAQMGTGRFVKSITPRDLES